MAFPVDEVLQTVRKRVKEAPAPPRPPPASSSSAEAAEGTTETDDGELDIWSVNLVYGELLVPSVVDLVGAALSHYCGSGSATNCELVFVDLGSGEGAPPLAAAASFPLAWKALKGIELVPRLHRLALAHRSGMIDETGRLGRADIVAALGRVSFECDDMLKDGFTWARECSIAFVNGTCYDEETLGAIFKAIESLSAGSLIIITSHKMPQSSGAAKLYELLHEGTYGASWGMVTARIYRRLKLPKWIAAIKT